MQINSHYQKRNVSGGAPGLSLVTGDSKLGEGLGGSLSIRKALGNVISYRLGYFGSIVTGKGSYTTPDFKNISHNLSIEFIVSLNTFSSYRGDPTSNLYVFGGAGYTISGTQDKSSDGNYHYTHPTKKFTVASIGHQRIFSTLSFGLGYAYKINKKFNLGIEERFMSPIQNVNYVTGADLGNGTKNLYLATLIKFNYNLFN